MRGYTEHFVFHCTAVEAALNQLRLCWFDFAEFVPAAHQIHAVATKFHPFGTETQPLLEARFSGQTDFSAGAEHAMPGHWLSA